MKARYLGKYEMDTYFEALDTEDEIVEYRFTHIEDKEDYYNSDLFMRTEYFIFNGIMTETNTSAIGCKILNDEEVKLWRIW